MPTTLFNRLKKNKDTNIIINKLTFLAVMENEADLLKEFSAGHKFEGMTTLAVLLIHGYSERLEDILQHISAEQFSKILQTPVIERILQSYKFDTINQLLLALPPERTELLIKPFLNKACDAYGCYATAFVNKAVAELERLTKLGTGIVVREFNLKELVPESMLTIHSEIVGGFPGSFLQLYSNQIDNLIQFFVRLTAYLSSEQQIELFLHTEAQDEIYFNNNLQKPFPLFLSLLHLSKISGIHTQVLVNLLLNLSKALWVPILTEGESQYARQFRNEVYEFFIDYLYIDPSLIPAFVECMQHLPAERRFALLNFGISGKQTLVIHAFLAEKPYKKFLALLEGFSLAQLMTILPLHRRDYMYFLLRSTDGKDFLQPWSSSYEDLENYYNSIDESAPEFHLICSLCIQSTISKLNELFNTPPRAQALSNEAAKEIEIAMSGFYLYLQSHLRLNSRIIDCDEIMYDLGMLLEQGSTVEAYSKVLFEWYDKAKINVFDTLKRHAPLAALEGLAYYYKIISTSGPYLVAELQEKALAIAIGYAEKSAKLRAYNSLVAEKDLVVEKADVSPISERSFFTTKRKMDERPPANAEIEAKNKVNKTDNDTHIQGTQFNC